MQNAFTRNQQLFAELAEQSQKDDREQAAKRVLQLRDQINDGFNVVRAQADAVLFEFGPSRVRKLKIRDDFRRWQPAIGTLLQVQVTFLQYLYQNPPSELPEAIAQAETAFEENMAAAARAMADEVAGKAYRAAPDIQESAHRLREAITNYYGASGAPIPPPLVDIVTLSQNLGSIVTPLYSDINATFTNPDLAQVHRPQLKP
jgi:multidrug resistance protein MdtO